MNEERLQALSVPDYLADSFVLFVHFLLGFLREQSAELSASNQLRWRHFEHPTSCQINAYPVVKASIYSTLFQDPLPLCELSQELRPH